MHDARLQPGQATGPTTSRAVREVKRNEEELAARATGADWPGQGRAEWIDAVIPVRA